MLLWAGRTQNTHLVPLHSVAFADPGSLLSSAVLLVKIVTVPLDRGLADSRKMASIALIITAILLFSVGPVYPPHFSSGSASLFVNSSFSHIVWDRLRSVLKST